MYLFANPGGGRGGGGSGGGMGRGRSGRDMGLVGKTIRIVMGPYKVCLYLASFPGFIVQTSCCKNDLFSRQSCYSPCTYKGKCVSVSAATNSPFDKSICYYSAQLYVEKIILPCLKSSFLAGFCKLNCSCSPFQKIPIFFG